MFNRLVCSIFMLCGSLFSVQAYAEQKTPEASVVLHGYIGGGDTQAYGLGYGGVSPTGVFGQVYVSQFSTEEDAGLGGAHGNRYDTWRLGFMANSFAEEAPNFVNLYLYKTQMDSSLIDRWGVGFASGRSAFISPSFKMLLLAELMPGAFSTNWADDIYLEYGLKAELEYLFGNTLSVSAGYHYGGALTGDNISLFNHFGLGVNVVF